jgi:hypothetical protein
MGLGVSRTSRAVTRGTNTEMKAILAGHWFSSGLSEAAPFCTVPTKLDT